jgi:hypothetical protein
MKTTNFFRCTHFIFASLLVTVVGGCASVAVTNEAIDDRTAFALSLPKGDFTVSNRVDDGVRSSYSVRTKSGKTYNCYVGGSVSVIGRVVSDAICNEVGGVASQAPTGQPTNPGNCNELLKAAGRC